jgi:hypothetical protein
VLIPNFEVVPGLLKERFIKEGFIFEDKNSENELPVIIDEEKERQYNPGLALQFAKCAR